MKWYTNIGVFLHFIKLRIQSVRAVSDSEREINTLANALEAEYYQVLACMPWHCWWVQTQTIPVPKHQREEAAILCHM
jgi:hypothetical protein